MKPMVFNLLFIKSVRSYFGRAAFVVLAITFLSTFVSAADKVYEKPSVFMKRHFGTLPKTQVISLTSAQSKQLKSIFGHKYASKRSAIGSLVVRLHGFWKRSVRASL